MKKYKVIARYYRPRYEDFTDNYEYYIETNKTIEVGDCIAVIDAASPAEIRCIIISSVTRLSKEDTSYNNIRRKIYIGKVETEFFHELITKKHREELLEQLEQRAAQASKMQYYETLASTDPEIASLLKELKEIS